ncbi:M57 family metalloprotease [Aquimarina agarilytica]|uniref:M57 family metalloprotease n=1 Tax=Aquimarina agarilytica TaxID=1087449 RepID=UPI000287D1CC|nr:M57 family metalloprotease [Aquimarina agarilytica]
MKKLKSITIGTIAMALLCMSCQSDEKETLNASEKDETARLSNSMVTKLWNLSLNPNYAERYSFETPEGKVSEGWKIEDVFITDAQLESNSANVQVQENPDNGKLYRVFNRVNVPNQGQRTLRIRGISLLPNIQEGLRRAIANYNNAGLKIKFQVTFGNGFTNEDIILYQIENNSLSAIATSPANGNPGRWMEISNGSNRFNINRIEALLTHELGHSLGLRHSDFGGINSCIEAGVVGGPFDQGLRDPAPANTFSVHIPGTDSNFDSPVRSVMMACSKDLNPPIKELTPEDLIALRWLF